jgi:hypothetical protein
MSGCAGFGHLKSASNPAATLEELRQKWDDYDVYYFDWRHCGVSLLFDLREDDKPLLVEGWTAVSDEAAFLQLMDSAHRRRFKRLYSILGSDGQFYGYLLARYECVNVRALNDGTLRVQGVYWVPGSALGPG